MSGREIHALVSCLLCVATGVLLLAIRDDTFSIALAGACLALGLGGLADAAGLLVDEDLGPFLKNYFTNKKSRRDCTRDGS